MSYWPSLGNVNVTVLRITFCVSSSKVSVGMFTHVVVPTFLCCILMVTSRSRRLPSSSMLHSPCGHMKSNATCTVSVAVRLMVFGSAFLSSMLNGSSITDLG